MHEIFTREVSLSDLRKLVLPFARQSGIRKRVDFQPVDKRKQLLRFRSGSKFSPVALDVFLIDQIFDDGSTSRGGSESLFCHRFAQLAVFDKLARTFHG